MLTRDKIDSSILQQGSEHKEQAHGHPDVDCLHIGHLQHPSMEESTFLKFFHGLCSGLTACINCLLFCSFILNFFSCLKKLFLICPIIWRTMSKRSDLTDLLHPSALFTLYFHLLFLPILLFLPFFLLFELLLLLRIILFILILFWFFSLNKKQWIWMLDFFAFCSLLG